MKEYRVSWEIDLMARNPREAAVQAREIHLSVDSIANVFDVREIQGPLLSHDVVTVDLSEPEEMA
jgi:hypothetical protein